MTRIDAVGSAHARAQLLGAALRFAGSAGQLRRIISLWRKRATYRHALARMSERELNDIGVGWCDIAEEASKPFWRA